MRVAINCLDVNPSFVGGVTSYVLGLLEGFASVGDDCHFRIFATANNRQLFHKYAKKNFDLIVMDDKRLTVTNSLCRTALISSSSKVYKTVSNTAFRKVRQIIEAQSDLVYTPTPVLRYYNSCKPSILSIHDIQHLHHPKFFNWARRLSRGITYSLSARHALYIQASSEYIKYDLLEHFPWLNPERVEVIPSGAMISTFATPISTADVCLRYTLPERFIFFPAQMWPHKNHLTVLKALKQIEHELGLKIPLILTGERFSAAREIFKFVADESMTYVRHLGKVPLEDMVALYQKAQLMITATLHESSSLPVLEAAAAGTAVIASRIPPIEELARTFELNLFNPLDVRELVSLLSSLWRDENKCSKQAAHNRRQAGLYSWDNTARGYLRLFRRIFESARPSTRRERA